MTAKSVRLFRAFLFLLILLNSKSSLEQKSQHQTPSSKLQSTAISKQGPKKRDVSENLDVQYTFRVVAKSGDIVDGLTLLNFAHVDITDQGNVLFTAVTQGQAIASFPGFITSPFPDFSKKKCIIARGNFYGKKVRSCSQVYLSKTGHIMFMLTSDDGGVAIIRDGKIVLQTGQTFDNDYTISRISTLYQDANYKGDYLANISLEKKPANDTSSMDDSAVPTSNSNKPQYKNVTVLDGKPLLTPEKVLSFPRSLIVSGYDWNNKNDLVLSHQGGIVINDSRQIFTTDFTLMNYNDSTKTEQGYVFITGKGKTKRLNVPFEKLLALKSISQDQKGIPQYEFVSLSGNVAINNQGQVAFIVGYHDYHYAIIAGSPIAQSSVEQAVVSVSKPEDTFSKVLTYDFQLDTPKIPGK